MPDRETNLLPMTILDGMILVAGCAVSAWLLSTAKGEAYVNLRPPRNMMDWLVLTAFLQYGPTIVGPILLFLQFIRGRRRRMMAGEIAWLVIGIELWPFGVIWRIDSVRPSWLDSVLIDGYMNWLFYGSPPLVLVCALAAWIWHFRAGRPRHWSHRLGLGMSLAQCVPSSLIIIGWIVGQ